MFTFLFNLKISKQFRIFLIFGILTAAVAVYFLAMDTGLAVKMIVAALTVGIYILMAEMYIRKYASRIQTINDALEDLSKGRVPVPLMLAGNDEAAKSSCDINNLIKGLNDSSEFALKLGEGNTAVSYSPLSTEDVLGNTLLKLKEGWQTIKNEEQKRNWATEGLAKFAELLHQDEDLGALSNQIIKYLVQILKASQGALFIVDDKNQQEKVLEMKACYAFKRTKYFNKVISVGEGLIGQAFLEGETIYLKEVPEDYILITSGMGDARPRNILISPLKREREIVGVLEIASFNYLEEHEIVFVEKLSENIAHAIISLKINEHTRQLLKESREQASQLQAQEEELRQNQEELQATQEEISRKYKELFDQLTELNYQSKFEQLKSITSTKKRNIEYYFDIIRSQVLTFSEDRMIVEALKEFKDSFYKVEDDLGEDRLELASRNVKKYYQEEFMTRLNDGADGAVDLEEYIPAENRTVFLQDLYIAGNPHPVGEKSLLEASNDGSEYSNVHKKYHNLLHHFLRKFGYYDIFLIDSKTGYMLYSVFKEVDFATNLLNGPYSETNFGEVVKESILSTDPDFVRLVDFQPYAPSYGTPASFIASSIYDKGEKIGILVFQMPINKINQILTGDNNWKNDGLGESGETFIVGEDHTLRSVSRELVENEGAYISSLSNIGYPESLLKKIRKSKTSILIEEVKQDSVSEALKGKSGVSLEGNNRGVKVLSAYAPLQIEDVNWVIMSTTKEDETSSMLNNLRQNNHVEAVRG